MIIQFNVFWCQSDYSIHLINIVHYTLESIVLVERIRKNKGFSTLLLLHLPLLLTWNEEYEMNLHVLQTGSVHVAILSSCHLLYKSAFRCIIC